MLDRFSQLTYDIVNHLQTLVPRSMFLDSYPNLIVGDIVYYKPDNSLLSARWTAGEVVDTKVGKEGLVREVITCKNLSSLGLGFLATYRRSLKSPEKAGGQRSVFQIVRT